MEDVYTIKVRSGPEARDAFPSERRYSASTVAGLGWVHAALAATAALLAALALLAPQQSQLDTDTGRNGTDAVVLAAAPAAVSVCALAAGAAAMLASVRWYVDRNIAVLLAASLLSALVSLAALVAVAAWFVSAAHGDIASFYRDQDPFRGYSVVERNGSHLLVSAAGGEGGGEGARGFTERVLCINVMIAAFLELLWSLLSVRISYRGVRSEYEEGGGAGRGRGGRVTLVTEIKGDDRLLRAGRLPPDVKHLFPAPHLHKPRAPPAPLTDSSSDIYRERMMSFLNRCATEDTATGASEPSEPSATPAAPPKAPTDTAAPRPPLKLRPIPEAPPELPSLTPYLRPSWGDTPDVPVYNQNTLDLENIFHFNKDKRRHTIPPTTSVPPTTTTSTDTTHE